VQLRFKDENCQSLLIGHRRLNVDDAWSFPIVPTADLSNPAIAANMEETLKEMNMAAFRAGDCPFPERLKLIYPILFQQLC
jgi:hypothetical protein